MSDYSLTVVDNSIVLESSDNVEMKIKETYSLTKAPTPDSFLVVQEKQWILGQLNLNKMLQNLDSCVDLLEIAYNAVNGMEGLHRSVSDIQIRFGDALITSNETVQGFAYKTSSIIDAFIETYECLLDGDEASAIETLKGIQKYAVAMRQKSEALGDTFDTLAKNTNSALNETIEKNAINYVQKEEIIKQNAEMEAQVAAMEALKKNLEEKVTAITADYSKVQKQQEKQEERAFALQLTGAILGGLGLAAKQGVDMYANSQVPGYKTPSGDSQQTQTQIGEFKTKKDNLEKDIKTIDDDNKTDQEKLEKTSDNAEKDALREKIRKANENKSSKQNEIKELDLKINALSKSIEKIGDSFSELGELLQDKAESYETRLNEIFKMKSELEKQERDNITKLAEYTKRISNTVIQKDSLEMAINSLITAVGCLRKVVSYLKDMVAFWKSIETCCDSLSGTETIDAVTRVQKKFSNDNELSARVQPYKEIRFMRVFIKYLVRWVALNSVCIEYVKAIETTRSNLNTSIAQKETSREEHWEQASKLAEKVNKKLTSQIEVI